MEDAILVIIALGAAYYLYRKMFKSGGCGCGKKSCSSKKSN